MIYFFKAIDESGFVVRGTLKALTIDELKASLAHQKFYLIQVKLRQSLISLNFKKKVSFPVMEEFCFQMSAFVRAGLTILEALDLLRDATNNSVLKSSLIQIIHTFQKGRALSASFKEIPEVFDDIFCEMIHAGEKTGDLGTTFDQLAQLFKWRHDVKNQIIKSVQYPLILLSVVLGLIGFLLTWTVPQMAEFFVSIQKDLNFSTKCLIFLSHHLGWTLKMLASAAGCLLLLLLSIRLLSEKGTVWTDQQCLKLPVMGKMIQKVELHRFLQVFISLLGSGISLIEALKGAEQNIHNLYLRKKLEKVRQEVFKGVHLSRSWHHASLDPLIGRLILMGETTGQLNQSLQHGIRFLKGDIDQISKQFIKALEPSLIIILGGVLGWLVVAIFLPLYDNILIF